MSAPLRERLNSLYAAFKLAKIDFLLKAFDDDIEFISYSPLEAFPFLGHHRGKAAFADLLKAGYREFEFIAYERVFTVCEGEDAAAVILFARFTHRRTGRPISTKIAYFMRLRQGLITELREFMDSFGALGNCSDGRWALNKAKVRGRLSLGRVGNARFEEVSVQGIAYTVVSAAIPRSAASSIAGRKPEVSRMFVTFLSATTDSVAKIAREDANP